jgi:ProP effector
MAIRSIKPKLSLPSYKAPARLPVLAEASRSCAGASPRPAIKLQTEEKVKPLAATPNSGTAAIVNAIKMRKLLAKRFPQCFKAFGQPKLPLKIGIDRDIIAAAPELRYRNILYAIADYTSGSSYLRTLIEGAARIDLNGDAAGIVTAAQEHYAQGRLAKRARASSKQQEVRHA